jgi:AAA domain/DnaA N-terminal domain
MPEKMQNDNPELWNRVLHSIKEKVSVGCFDTWFRPIHFNGSRDDVFELAVPTESFRQALLENFASVLNDSVAQVMSTPCRLNVSVPTEAIATLPVVPAYKLGSDSNYQPWLIERLWSIHAVGFVSGPPKSFKTWTVLEMAISVATGLPCLGAFPVHRSGPVLLYAAEDPATALRLRLLALARNHGRDLDQIDIRIICVDSLRLDRPVDREKLSATVELHRPALLVLDPLVRLHGLDENQAAPMAELLGHIRALQRASAMAIAIVHHSRKASAHSAGQTLRGSSDLYAFVDSLVSLQRRHGRVTLSAEHRSAPELAPVPLELVAADQPDAAPYLRIAATAHDAAPQQNPLEERIVNFLRESHSPGTTDSLRAVMQVRKQRLLEALRNLIEQHVICRDGNQYILIANQDKRRVN